MTSFWRFLCFFAFRSFLVKFRFFCKNSKTAKGVRPELIDSIVDCNLHSFSQFWSHLCHPGCHRPGGQSAPRAPRLELANFWQFLPPLNRPPWFTIWSQNWKILKNKKVCSQKKMKCDNNSIYELQDGIYSSQGTPWPCSMIHPMTFSLISKIHSSELIILWFWRFLQKKKNLQSQQKNFCTINTASLVR